MTYLELNSSVRVIFRNIFLKIVSRIKMNFIRIDGFIYRNLEIKTKQLVDEKLNE